MARYWKKDPRTIAYHLVKLEKAGFLEKIPDRNKLRFRLDNIELIYDFFIAYDVHAFGEPSKKWMYFVQNKGGDLFADKVLNVVYEIFLHPYYS